MYFDFVQDFVKYYAHSIGDNIIPLLESIVQRVVNELAKLQQRGEKNNIIINRCWNIIRVICENKEFMP